MPAMSFGAILSVTKAPRRFRLSARAIRISLEHFAYFPFAGADGRESLLIVTD